MKHRQLSQLLLLSFLFVPICSWSQIYNFQIQKPKKDTFIYRIHESQMMTITSSEGENTQTEEKTVDYHFKVRQSSPSLGHKVSVTIKDIYVKRNSPIDFFEYDPENPTTYKGIESKAFDRIINSNFDMTLSPKGNIAVTRPISALSNIIFQTADIFDTPDIETLKDSIKTQLTSKTIENSMRYFEYCYQTDTARIGSSWTIIDTLYPTFGVLAKMTYTLKDVQNNIALIEVKSDLYKDPNYRGLDLDLMHLKFNLSGLQEGVVLLDTETGWIRKMSLVHRLDGKMTVFFLDPQGVILKTTIKGSTDFDLINY
jgi:hypothetical protein